MIFWGRSSTSSQGARGRMARTMRSRLLRERITATSSGLVTSLVTFQSPECSKAKWPGWEL
ncbi:MAG TPA: hypothetical protein DEA08_11255 [Planctomycetes bacterium]|nr:hypothetical protein [Planctomycetota bacterium]